MVLSNMAAKVDLQLARADCLRDQRRYDEAASLIQKAITWRERQLGGSDPATLASLYDLSSCLRTRYVAAAAAGEACEGCDDDEAVVFNTTTIDHGKMASAAITANSKGGGVGGADGLPPPRGDEGEGDAVRARRVAAIDAMQSVAPELDERWQNGLRALVAAESCALLTPACVARRPDSLYPTAPYRQCIPPRHPDSLFHWSHLWHHPLISL